MKKVCIMMCMSCCLVISVCRVHAAENTPMDLPSLPEYLGTHVVPLTAKEKQALRLSNTWMQKGLDPVISTGGKLLYVHGASIPTIIASPLQVCDVELQAGENINEIIVGDSARWMVEHGQAGNNTHIFIKPIDSGLETSAVITTDRRIYHLRLISQKENFIPYVGFTYADEMRVYAKEKQKVKDQEVAYTTTTMHGQSLADLNFGYKVSGKAAWKPERIYDNGQQIFIQLPDIKSEMPVLLVRKGGENILVNYRVQGQTMVVDGIFEEIVLLIGVGNDKEQVLIKRG